MTVDEQIKKVNDKLQQLLRQYQLLQKENERLKQAVSKLEEQRAESLQQVEKMEQQINILKASAGTMNDTDKKAFEKKINQYLKEIDKSIALLSE